MESSGIYSDNADWNVKPTKKNSELMEWKQWCLSALSDIANCAEKMSVNSYVSAINSIKADLEGERFYLAVLGSFKRGKSSLINALLGSEVLPIGILPLTSIVTKISFGKEARAEVFLVNGESKNISIHELAAYVTESGNPCNKKGVAEVRVYVNNEFLEQGVVLVDTPGIGSVHVHNTSSTYGFLPHVDAGIFVIGADPPVSKEEIDFLAEMLRTFDRVFIVLNKIDLISESDLAEAVAYSKSIIASHLKIDEPEIYPLSARFALEFYRSGEEQWLKKSRLTEFIDSLRKFLSNERAVVMVQSAIRKGLRNSSDLLTLINMQVKMLQQSVEEVQEKIDWLEKEMSKIERCKLDLDHVVVGKCEQAVKRAEAIISEKIAEKTPILLEQIDKLLDEASLDGGRRNLTCEMEKSLTALIEREMKPIIDILEEELQKTIQNIAFSSGVELEKTISEFSNGVGRIFQIEMPRHHVAMPSISRSRLYFDEVRLFDYECIIPVKTSYFLPKILFVRELKKRAKEAVIDEMDKCFGKMRYDFARRLSDGVRPVKSEIASRMQMALELMSKAVQLGKNLKDEAQLQRNSQIKELLEIRATVEGAAGRLSYLNSLLGEKA